MRELHRIHSIDISRTYRGKHAIIFKLGGILDGGMERILRLEFDKTLVRRRDGGVIIDLTEVTELSSAVVVRIMAFGRHLEHDQIHMVIVISKVDKCNELLVKSSNRFDLVPTYEAAKELLGIEEEDEDEDLDD